MRMLHYFTAMAVLVIPALLWTMWTGVNGSAEHLNVGLVASVFAVAAHSLVILFMIITGRLLREAIRARQLSQEFLDELNDYFSNKKAYPLAFFAVMSVVTAAVLGYGHRAFDLPPTVHMLVGLVAIVTNALVIPMELRTLRENQGLLDRAASQLDAIDRELEEQGESLEEPPFDPGATRKWGLAFGFGALLPYFYWSLIVWRGDFSRVSIHPWIELSAFGFLIAWMASKEREALAESGSNAGSDA